MPLIVAVRISFIWDIWRCLEQDDKSNVNPLTDSVQNNKAHNQYLEIPWLWESEALETRHPQSQRSSVFFSRWRPQVFVKICIMFKAADWGFYRLLNVLRNLFTEPNPPSVLPSIRDLLGNCFSGRRSPISEDFYEVIFIFFSLVIFGEYHSTQSQSDTCKW